MDLQGRELKVTLIGNDVQLLQTELTQIGLPVPDAERKNANFGEGTQKAVAQFQKDHGLQPTGEVDAETARAINSVVKAMTFIVEGESRAGSARVWMGSRLRSDCPRHRHRSEMRRSHGGALRRIEHRCSAAGARAAAYACTDGPPRDVESQP